jgi:MtaA/CmuA family methyltransferase
MTGRERILSLLNGKQPDRPPVMPITMQLAAKTIGACYRSYETDFRVLAEGQIRVAEEFGFDYVNTMSDPAREAADCGAAVEYFENAPAALIEEGALLADKTKLAQLRIPDPLGGGRMHQGIQAVGLLKERVGRDLLVEGWIEGPCAEAADLRGINALMLDFFDDPKFVRDLFAFVVAMELQFAREQIGAGAELIGVGDAAASLVGPRLYREFVWPCEKKLVDGVHDLGAKVRLHICGNTGFALEEMGRLGCDIIDLDYPVPLADARAKMGPDQILLGNLHPVETLWKGNPDSIATAVAKCHRQAGARYIVGAGCELPPNTPPENARALSEYSRGCAPL